MIKNKQYRQFLDKGIITTLKEEQIEEVLKNLKSSYQKEGRAVVIALYYTGARPNEVLRLKPKDLSREKSYVKVELLPSKRGLPRTVYLPYRKPMVKELYAYAMACFPNQYMFYHFKDSYKRTRLSKKGLPVVTTEITNKLRYHVKKWFTCLFPDGIPPYFLRHNRFSKLTIAGVSDRDIMQLKGSKTIESIRPYQHMSAESAKKTAKKID